MNTIRVFHSFIKSNILILLILAINTAYSIRIGLISNTTFIASNISQTFSNMSCTQCTCTALIAFAVGWNCMTNNKTCYLIKNYISTDIGLVRKDNATFFFQKIPPEPLTTTVHAMTTQAPSTTTTTPTTTTTTPTCTALGATTFLSGTNPASWTQYNSTYTASSTSFTLRFAFRTDPNRDYYLDDVSATNINTTSVELLQNPSFENSTTLLIGWMVWCNNTCSGTGVHIISGTDCFMSIGNCFQVNCHAGSAVSFLSQSFSSVINQTYRISFRLRQDGTGGSGQMKFDFTFG